jgi:hypothetical protein
MADTLCRKCLLREALPADYKKYVEGLLKRISPADRPAPAAYEARLNVCRACEQLNMGTCMGCGCLVELRAAYKKEKCPFGKW